MKPDDELCLCFHVSKRKVQNYIRVMHPRRASELSESEIQRVAQAKKEWRSLRHGRQFET